MRLTVFQQAGPGEVYAPGAFAHNVGQMVPITMRASAEDEGEMLAMGRCVSAVVAPDGRSASITVEIGDPTA